MFFCDYIIGIKTSKMNALTIIKTYPDGEMAGGVGFYRWVLTKTKITEEEMMSNDLSCPFFGKKSILLGVKKNSFDWSNINPLATELLGQTICGDCVFIFPYDEEADYMKFTDREYEVICGVMKAKLLKIGANPMSFQY